MADIYELVQRPELHDPLLIVTLEGWVDAGLGAGAALAALLGSVPTEVVANFDADNLLDHRARRPVVRIVDGVNSGLMWPEIQVRSGRADSGQDLLFLVGPDFTQAILLLLVIGWSFAVYSIGTNTFVQVRSPDRMQGRMVSLYSMLFIGVTPIGNLFAGIVAHFFGPAAAVWVGGALTATGGLAVLAYFGTKRG